jgi:2'-5' RNA ligase
MRLFVAVRPPAEVIDVLAGIDRPRLAGVRWTEPDQWHVTLRFFGEVDDPSVIVRALSSVQLPTATATMGPRVKWVGRLLWAPVAGLTDLATEVVDATRGIGERPELRTFRGHITLVRQRSRERNLAMPSIAATWTVRQIELIRSHLEPEGARYETLERFGLAEN